MEQNSQNSWIELVRFAIIAAIIIIPIRLFIAQPFIVSGSSMDPTFHNGDYLIIDELSFYLRSPARGEVVVLRYPNDPKKYFIKRVIGLPGETLEIKNNEIFITTDGKTFKLEEEYLEKMNTPDMAKTLMDQEYFVMGDNRQASFDSRRFGAVNEPLIRGRALLRLWPLNQLDFLPGAITIE